MVLMKTRLLSASLLLATLVCAAVFSHAQDEGYFKTGTGLAGVPVRLAVPDFKPGSGDPQIGPLNSTFNQVLWNDLENAGIFEMVSRSFYPKANPGSPQEIVLAQWSPAPANANLVAFGNLGVSSGKVMVQGWLDDARNTQNPQVLAKQYSEDATPENARLIAHRFADEIIFRMGGGLQGIAETKIYFVSSRTGHKELWMMDYDGFGQKQLTRQNSIALGPRVSPDGSRIAFTSFARGKPDIAMFSLDLGRTVSFPTFFGTNTSPSWSGDGTKLAFASSMRGDPEIFSSDINGGNPKRLTAVHGPDVQPVWNPKTAAQIIWVSGRNGLPQIWMMEADGSNPRQLTTEGYAVSPSWSPNGQFVAFSWIRHYGPGAPGAQDIYIMEIASGRFLQLTHDGGRNDYPSWSPDGRHLVFQSTRSGSDQIWTMLADGTHQQQLTREGQNSQPDWGHR
jgi:TolB protein